MLPLSSSQMKEEQSSDYLKTGNELYVQVALGSLLRSVKWSQAPEFLIYKWQHERKSSKIFVEEKKKSMLVISLLGQFVLEARTCLFLLLPTWCFSGGLSGHSRPLWRHLHYQVPRTCRGEAARRVSGRLCWLHPYEKEAKLYVSDRVSPHSRHFGCLDWHHISCSKNLPNHYYLFSKVGLKDSETNNKQINNTLQTSRKRNTMWSEYQNTKKMPGKEQSMEKVLGTEQAPSKSLLTEAMRARGDRRRPLEWDSEGSGETKSNGESWQRLGTRNTMAVAGSSTRSLLGE